jgi:Predicted membrane protein
MTTFKSDLSNKNFPVSEKISGKSVRKSVFELIKKDYPNFTSGMFLSDTELNIYRQKYVESFLTKQIGQLTKLEKTVLDSLKDKTTLSDKLDGDEQQNMTFGQRIADKVASFGGSWTFIISFSAFLLVWIGINIYWLGNKGFDPYPFILLNLILSSLAAVQAPVIMMSQNRQEEKDRERGKKDYMINLKSELEVRMLHEKMDHLIISQQEEVLEIHKVQVDLMNDILKRIEKLSENEKE